MNRDDIKIRLTVVAILVGEAGLAAVLLRWPLQSFYIVLALTPPFYLFVKHWLKGLD